jgi:hypothetical protein
MAVAGENLRRATDLAWFDRPIEVDLQSIAARVRKTVDEIELRRVWPEVLGDYPSRTPRSFLETP